nr:arginine--tRNA ligase, chloroplastic/mitochondrial [Tanacetum cinerariifolium]
YVIEEKKLDWIVYVTPVHQQEYIGMCFTAAKLEKWIQSDMEGKRAAIRRIIKNSGEDVDVLKKALELILEDDEECGKSEEHMLEIHLLEFGGVRRIS